jgi:hypothetical protein
MQFNARKKGLTIPNDQEKNKQNTQVKKKIEKFEVTKPGKT